MSEISVSPKKSNVLVQYGLFSAVASLLFFVVLYLLGSESFTSPLAWLSMAVPVVFAVLACLKARKENDGFLEFREALKISFGILVITGLVTSLFSFLLFNVIDPSFAESMKQVTIERTQKMMANFKVPQEEIDKQINKMITDNIYSFGSIAQSFLFGCILYFIISLIIAAIVKKKKPEFAD